MATYRHKTIRRFRVGEFEFKNGLLVIKDEKKNESFRRLWTDMPRRDQLGIVEIDEEALARLEKPMARRVIRGVGDTGLPYDYDRQGHDSRAAAGYGRARGRGRHGGLVSVGCPPRGVQLKQAQTKSPRATIISGRV